MLIMKSVTWNPWHGCTKISPGCAHCYVYRIDSFYDKSESNFCRKTGNFYLPVRLNRQKQYKIEPGTLVYTCFTSDFFLEDADEWREEAWNMIRKRSDCTFLFYTKRIERMRECLPCDWGVGYDNVIIGCTVENEQMAKTRLPVFISMPIKHRIIGVEPMLERINIEKYLSDNVESVSVGGESGEDARVCDFDWVLDIRNQCIRRNVAFTYHQTGSKLIKDGRIYNIPRAMQHIQAKKASVDFLI